MAPHAMSAMPQCDCRSSCRSYCSAAQECTTLEANHGRRYRAKQSRKSVQYLSRALWQKLIVYHAEAARRTENALRQTGWPDLMARDFE